MATGHEMTIHRQPQAFRCCTCGGLVLKEPKGPRGPNAACPCGGVRLVGAPFDVVTVDEREVEASQTLPVLVGVVDQLNGESVCSILVEEDRLGSAVLDLRHDLALRIDTNPAPYQKIGAAHAISFYDH